MWYVDSIQIYRHNTVWRFDLSFHTLRLGCFWILRFLNDLMIYSILRAKRSSINRHVTIHPSGTVFQYFIWLDVLFARSTIWTTVAVPIALDSPQAWLLTICRRNTFRASFPSDHILHHATEPHCQFWRSCAYYRMATTRSRMLSAPFNLS